MLFKNIYFDNYPKTSSAGYWSCSRCGVGDNIIRAHMENHGEGCEWRIMNIEQEMAAYQKQEDAFNERQRWEMLVRLDTGIRVAVTEAKQEIQASFDEGLKLLNERFNKATKDLGVKVSEE